MAFLSPLSVVANAFNSAQQGDMLIAVASDDRSREWCPHPSLAAWFLTVNVGYVSAPADRQILRGVSVRHGLPEVIAFAIIGRHQDQRRNRPATWPDHGGRPAGDIAARHSLGGVDITALRLCGVRAMAVGYLPAAG